METPSATLLGMEMEGSARARRAREPRVDDALRSRSAERMRARVERRRGRDPDCGVPVKERRWEVNVKRGCFRVCADTWVVP